MKKYITIAALLAAGTAFANAATGTETNAAIAAALVEAGYTAGSEFVIRFDVTQSSIDGNTGFIQFADAGWIVNQSKTYWGINTADTNTFEPGSYEKKKSDNGLEFEFDYTATEIAPLWAQNANLGGSDTRDANTLSVSIGYDEDIGSGVELSYDVSNIVDTWYFTDVTLDATDIKLDGGLTVSDLKVTVTAVPEPSAFGLLAGIGALALVASRRRRK